MNKITLTALQGSIAKWEAIVKGTGVDDGTDNCPLCELFYNNELGALPQCNGCPVAEKTGVPGCIRTPYTAWSAMTLGREYCGADTPVLVELAQRELDFLREVLSLG